MKQCQNYSELDVVNCLQTFIISEDFKLSQAQFFLLNCKNFEQEQENKHIYMDLFKEYVKILDQVIETKILQKFSDLDLGQFFQNFEKKFKDYQDSDFVENIKSFLDFNLFKTIMLKAKLGLVNSDTKIGAAYEELDFDYSKFMSLYNEDSKQKWTKCLSSSSEINLEVLSRKEKLAGMDVMRIDGVFKGVDYKTIAWMSMNLDSLYYKNTKSFKEVRLIEKTPKYQIIYFKCAIPIMSDRDFVVKIIEERRNKEIIIVMNSVIHEKAPEVKGVVRGELFDGFVTRPSKNNSADADVTEIGYWNMKGYIPKILLNMFMSKVVSEEYRMLWKLCLEQEKLFKQS